MIRGNPQHRRRLQRLAVARTVIRAPYAGVVRERLAAVGDVAAPGTPLLSLAASADAEVHARVPAVQVDGLLAAAPPTLVAGGAVRKLRASPWRALFAGLAALLVGPFLIAFAFVTIVGIPLALMLAALYGALAYLSHVAVALWLGHLLLRTPGPQTSARVLSALAVGLFLLYFSAALPGVASLLAFPVVVLGSGALVLAFLQRPFISVALSPPPLPKRPEPTDNPE